MKQTLMSALIYSSDNDDGFPPFFTFESEKSRDSYLTVTFPYSKNKDIAVCPTDRYPDRELEFKPGMEGDPKIMSYVHSQSLKGLIPNYSSGNRLLAEKNIEHPADSPYLRDPIRGFGTFSPDSTGREVSGFLSPHRGVFTIGFLDGHVKGKSPLSVNSYL
jgi:prepilin-type processing-associated H-X9-DG protein